MTKRTLVVGVISGAAAGLAMAGIEMIYGWASSAHSAWDAPMGIWAYIGVSTTSAGQATISGQSCSGSAVTC